MDKKSCNCCEAKQEQKLDKVLLKVNENSQIKGKVKHYPRDMWQNDVYAIF